MKKIYILKLIGVCALLLMLSSCTENENIFFAKEHPVLKIDGSSTLSFGASTGSLNFSITNSGTGSFKWYASKNKSWLNLSHTSGTIYSSSDIVTVTVDRIGLSSGTHSGQINVTSEWGNATINVSMEVQPGKWLSYDDGSFENGTLCATYGYLAVRFTKPTGWSATRVTKVKINIYSSEGAYEEFRIKSWDDYKFSDAEYWPDGLSTTLKDNVSQNSGWKEHTINHTFTSSQFFVGIYHTSSDLPWIGKDEGSYCAGRSYLKNSTNSWIVYIGGCDFGIRVYVEPASEKDSDSNRVGETNDLEDETVEKGMWLEPDITDMRHCIDNNKVIKVQNIKRKDN